MISIITAIHNQLGVNRLYYESLIRNTVNPFELIIIDNNSTDGSCEYFENLSNVKVIRTGANYNYPYCQNLGIKHSNYDILCFFNNDLILTKNWDVRMVHILESNKNIQALSFASNDHLENKKVHKKLSRKWKRIKYPIQYIAGNSSSVLQLMMRLMYGNLDNFSEKRFQKWKYKTIEAYSGSSIVLKRGILEKIGLWDERIQTADYDLFNRMKEYSLKNKSALPLQLALGIYIHHFQKLTIKKAYPPFANKKDMISIFDKWGEKTDQLRKDIVD